MQKLKAMTILVGKIVWFIIIAIVDVVIMAGVSFAIIFLYAYHHSPSADLLVHRPISETTVIYDRTGDHVLYEIHGEENRRIIAHDQISDHLRRATVAIEDERFYHHFGVDVIGIARALLANIASSDTEQGASTITQQLVRNAFLTREKTIVRKFKEMVLAIKVERHYTKEQILDFYLNEVPYGSNAYGAQTAAHVFFGKDASALTIDEAALLAALPKATTYLSPYGGNTDALKARVDVILQKLQEQGIYEEAEINAARARDTLAAVIPLQEAIEAPHFVFYVREELEKVYTPEELQRGGLHVYTTLDYDMQKRAEKIVQEYADTLPRYGASNASLVAIDPRTGGVQAMVGSIDYYNDAIDGNVNVALRPRQPGSSFKPIVYAAAFEKGFQPETLLYDVTTSFGPDGSGKDYVPQNFDGSNHGLVSMRKALAGSLNIPAVKTLYLVGVDEAIDFAEKLGFTTFANRNRYGLSIVLGGGEVRLLDEVGAFAVFANDGKKAPVTGITRVTGPDGEEDRNVLTRKTEQVIAEDVAHKINSILSDNQARSYVFGTVNPLHIPGKTVAAKTGTTQDYRDAWTVGYTPSLAVGVWVGNNDATFMHYGALGSKVASPLWRRFMESELQNKEDEKFQPYKPLKDSRPMITGTHAQAGLGKAKYYNINTGKRISSTKAKKKDPKDVRVEYAVPSHTILYYINKDNPLDETLKPDFNDPMLWRWEKAIGNTELYHP